MSASVDYRSAFSVFADPAPVTRQNSPPPNMTLKGTMLAEPASYSSALLDIQGEVANYRVGKDIKDTGYTVIAVDWNEAVLEDASGGEIVLTLSEPMVLDQEFVANSNSISNRRLPNRSTNNVADSALQNGMDMEAAQEVVEDTQTAQAQSAIEEAVSELQKNPASYLSRMGVMALGDGYQVTDAMPSGIKDRLGLESGDKVLSVNGQAVGNDPTQDTSLLQQVQQSGQAQIQVQRGDQVITIRQQF